MPVRRLSQHAQAFFAQPLETVWRRTRLKSPAADYLRAPARNDFRGLFNLIAIFHAARASHHYNLVTADFDAVQLHNGAARPEMPARQFVRRHDAVAFLDAVHHLELDGIDV